MPKSDISEKMNEVTPTMRCNGDSHSGFKDGAALVPESVGGMNKIGVRRLTPTECERLQGVPDDFTRFGIDEKGHQIEMSDSARYFVLGNGVTANVAEWIGLGIPKSLPEKPF